MRIALAFIIGFAVFWLGKSLTWAIISPSLAETMNAYVLAHRAAEPGRVFATAADDVRMLSLAIGLSINVFWSLIGGIVGGLLSPPDALRSALLMSVLAILDFALVQWWMVSTMRDVTSQRIVDLLATELPWVFVTIICLFLGALAGRRLRTE